MPLTAPRLSFNGAITAGRVVSYVDVSLADVKAIKTAAGGTFNDAITGICGTAFRRYLDQARRAARLEHDRHRPGVGAR